MDYSKFRVEDFVTDEYFIQWIKRPDNETNAFWNAWISQNPHRINQIREAREIILHLEFKTNLPPEGRFLEVWEKIIQTDPEEIELPFVYTLRNNPEMEARPRRWVFGVAASITVLLLCTIAFFLNEHRTIEIATTYGEARTVSLPDSTKVTLNSNSKISYSLAEFNKGHRLISLTGEAFFSVVHKDDNSNFIVHTEELNVEVLGTKFNVNSRRGNTKVILKEGRVKLNMNGGPDEEDLVMVPGEYVEFTDKGKLTHKTVDTNDYLEWRNNRLVFVGTTLQEIAQLLEDNYGYRVVFEDDSLRQKKFTGSSSVVEIEELIDKLSRLYDLQVDKTKNQVTLGHSEDSIQ